MLASTEVVGRGNNLHVKHGDDSGLIVRFYFNKVHEKDFIKINVPGDSKSEWDYAATDADRQRFSKQWDAYQKQQSQVGGETPLTQWPITENNEAQIRMLASFNVITVENLANIHDGFIDKMGPGIRDLQRKAKAWLVEQAEEVKAAKFADEIRSRDLKIETQDQQIKEMQQALAQMQAQFVALTERKKPGRKPKQQEIP